MGIELYLKDQYRGGAPSKLPMVIMLNQQANYGLFIKADQLRLAGFHDELAKECGQRQEYTHTFNDGSKSEGLLFQNPYLHIVSQSPRYIEINKKGEKHYAGQYKKGQIITSYDQEGGFDARESLGKELTTLRTFYLAYFVGSKDLEPEPATESKATKTKTAAKPKEKCLLSRMPFVISLHGSAAAEFGNAFAAFKSVLNIAFTEAMVAAGQVGDEYVSLNDEAIASAMFCPKFIAEKIGEEEKSWVSCIENFIEPSAKTVERFLHTEKAEYLASIRKTFSNFTPRVLTESQEAFGIIPQKTKPADIRQEQYADTEF